MDREKDINWICENAKQDSDSHGIDITIYHLPDNNASVEIREIRGKWYLKTYLNGGHLELESVVEYGELEQFITKLSIAIDTYLDFRAKLLESDNIC